MATSWNILMATIALIGSSQFFCGVTSYPTQQDFEFNSIEHYDDQTASWIFIFHLRNAAATDFSTKINMLRVTLELIGTQNHLNTVEGFSSKRFQIFKLLALNNSKVFQKTIVFDHAYSGDYKLKVDGCENRISCIKQIYEADLGAVTTHLRNFDVSKMNMSIRTTSLDMSGIDVAFTVHYHNKTDAFLPFVNFEVTLIPSDARKESFSIETSENRVEFRQWPNCFNLARNFTVEKEPASHGCFNLTDGMKYTTRIDPIDSRCNYPRQVVASIKRPCRRYIMSEVAVYPIRNERNLREEANSTISSTHVTRKFPLWYCEGGRWKLQY